MGGRRKWTGKRYSFDMYGGFGSDFQKPLGGKVSREWGAEKLVFRILAAPPFPRVCNDVDHGFARFRIVGARAEGKFNESAR